MPTTAKSLPVHLQRVVSSLLLTAWVVLGPAALRAQPAEPVLVRDFAPGSSPYSLAASQLTAVGGLLYFSGQDPVHGTELWVSDGSAAGTRRLADLCPGICSSEPGGFTDLGHAVLFHASEGNTLSLFRIEGSRVEKVVSAVDYLSGWARLGSHVYYLAGFYTLFETDGTPEGTRQIADLRPESCNPYTLCSQPEDFKAVAGAIYFVLRGQLYRLLEGGPPRPIFPMVSARGFTELDPARVIFHGCTGVSGRDCHTYVTDGTPAGTVLLGLDATWFFEASQIFFRRQGRVYFQTHQVAPPQYRLFSTNGTLAGTREETGFPAGTYWQLLAATPNRLFYSTSNALHAVDPKGVHSQPLLDWSVGEPIGQLGDRIFFTYGDPGGIARPGFTRLAVSSGEPSGTFDLAEGFSSNGGVVFGDHLYFARELSNAQAGLWRSDGTVAGTSRIALPSTAPNSSWPKSYALGDALVAEVYDRSVSFTDFFLWRVDPAALTSNQVDPQPRIVRASGKNRMIVAESEYAESRLFGYDGERLEELPAVGLAGDPVVADGDQFFFFTDVFPGQKLWESDGSSAGTRLLLEFPPRKPCSSYCNHGGALVPSGDRVYVLAGADGPPDRPRLSVWDRTANERRILIDPIWPFPGLMPFPGGKAILQRSDPQTSQRQLWLSDGTGVGTQPFFDLPASDGVVATLVGERLWLQLYSSGAPDSWWISDGTTAGTRPTTALGAGRRVGQPIPAGNHAFLVGFSEAHGLELGYTDGTSTRWLDLRPGPESSIVDLFYLPWYHVLADGRLVFAAHADEAGYEPWISDGTAAGTYRLADVNPGEDASSPGEFAEAGGRLFFQASHPDSGRELWSLELPPRFAPCTGGRACLFGNRFEAEVTAHTADGDFVGKLATSTPESGIFTFFSADNWEMLVKVLDGCNQNGKHWVFAAGATDVEFTLRVQDRATGLEKIYRNAGGQAARAITDTDAFSCF